MENDGTQRESQGFGRDTWISLTLFLEVVIKRKSNAWEVRPFERLFETASSTCLSAWKQTMKNIVMATVEFSLDNTWKKFADLSGNQLPLSSNRLINWSKNSFGKIAYPKG